MTRCEMCGEAEAIARSNLCRPCHVELDYLSSLDYQLDQNFEYCRDCGTELSRAGHCFDCLDRMVGRVA